MGTVLDHGVTAVSKEDSDRDRKTNIMFQRVMTAMKKDEVSKETERKGTGGRGKRTILQ